VACKQENSLGPDIDELIGSQGPSWIKIHHVMGSSDGERTDQIIYVPLMCHHCKNAPCVKGCPTKATYYDEKGIVCFDEKKCIGCKYCVEVCPYQIRSFDPQKKVGSKCQLCLPRLEEGKKPRCVETCPAGARSFQWISEEGIENLGQFEKSFNLLTEFGTNPSVSYRLKLKFGKETKK
jgi:Fe-S-cluster-containing dehydrogenase component